MDAKEWTAAQIHAANQRRWNAAAPQWARRADSRSIWKHCTTDPSLALSDPALKAIGEVAGKHIAVLGSGDNEVVFALAGRGAEVTSVDISEVQLAIAQDRATQLGLSVEFLRADVTQLKKLRDASFDLVYTGGHVAVWVSDLWQYYAEASRILRPGGKLVVDEYHPFRRIWAKDQRALRIEMPYWERGPFQYFLDDDVLTPGAGTYESYEFHWSVADFIQAVLDSGCQIEAVREYGQAAEDWEGAPLKGLPNCLLVVGRKII